MAMALMTPTFSFVMVISLKAVRAVAEVEAVTADTPVATLAARPVGADTTAPAASAAVNPEAALVMPRLRGQISPRLDRRRFASDRVCEGTRWREAKSES